MSRLSRCAVILARLSKEEISMYEKHFNTFDLNQDGVISARELEKVSRRIGYRMSHAEIQVCASPMATRLTLLMLLCTGLVFQDSMLHVIFERY